MMMLMLMMMIIIIDGADEPTGHAAHDARRFERQMTKIEGDGDEHVLPPAAEEDMFGMVKVREESLLEQERGRLGVGEGQAEEVGLMDEAFDQPHLKLGPVCAAAVRLSVFIPGALDDANVGINRRHDILALEEGKGALLKLLEIAGRRRVRRFVVVARRARGRRSIVVMAMLVMLRMVDERVGVFLKDEPTSLERLGNLIPALGGDEDVVGKIRGDEEDRTGKLATSARQGSPGGAA